MTTDMWNKIGITFKAYQRGANAGLLGSDNVFTHAERERMQALDGRDLRRVQGPRHRHPRRPAEEADRRPGRRPGLHRPPGAGAWPGRSIGTLQDAITYIAGQANLKEYDVRIVPEPKNLLQQIVEQAAGGENDPAHLLTPVALRRRFVDEIGSTLSHSDRPACTHQIQTALRELQLIQHEGAALVMPEMRFAGRARRTFGPAGEVACSRKEFWRLRTRLS